MQMLTRSGWSPSNDIEVCVCVCVYACVRVCMHARVCMHVWFKRIGSRTM